MVKLKKKPPEPDEEECLATLASAVTVAVELVVK